tara:strand:+ start:679 stop:1362 length:684 start_codon:yes stop_codon:yes gene_type:complete
MKKNILSIVFFVIFITSSFSHVKHYENYSSLEYELFRNNKLIGYHNYKFKNDKKHLNVKSIIKFKITKLGIDLYKYDAVSEEDYVGNQLIKFSSKTNQNDKIKNTEISYDGKKDKLIITGSENQLVSHKNNPVGTWWNHEIVQAQAQISAISGRIIEQKVTFLGEKKLNLNGKVYNSLHFNISSSDEKLPEKKKLNTDIWYEKETKLWLKAAFNKTGYWEYRLKKYN